MNINKRQKRKVKAVWYIGGFIDWSIPRRHK